MAQGSGLTRGDRRRNQEIAALRGVVRRDRAVLAIDLGEDKQVAALMDHDNRVLARKVATVKAHELDPVLGWATHQAAKYGLDGVTVACEPTGHRWKALMGLADAAGHGFVCVQSLAVHVAREGDDYTRDKTDHRDAVLIGKLAARLDCYLPERADETWARLRHLGARRFRLVADQTACLQQIADLLACAWPAALSCAAKPLESITWLACIAVVTDRCNGNPAKLRAMGHARFVAAVRRELPRWGGRRVYHQIVNRLWDALADSGGVSAQRRGALERVHLVMDDWRSTKARLADTEARMLQVLDELGLTELVTSIDGLSAIGAAVILAETGDMNRFASARSVVKHAGLNPAENSSATFRGLTRISHRGRPRLRAAAWRAVWGALPHNRVLYAKHAHLTSRDGDRLASGQARAACAAALLRWLYAVVTKRQPWDRRIASGRLPATIAMAA
ncbi:IS110 family transposase [Nonomuraea sp. NPDC046802]|uniref:IS110 family transposase n=1 Tax=Nonomuraea sp. NPDC046802 TaxID=3154919 RepID=UPI0033E815F0